MCLLCGHIFLYGNKKPRRGRGGARPARSFVVMTILWVIRRGGIYAARCSHPDKSTQWVNGTGRIYASPTNLPKICNLPSKFIDRPNPLKHSVSAGFPFCFPLPHPALPQSARRAAVRSFFLLFDSFPVCIAAPLTGALCPLATQPAFPHTPLVFRTKDSSLRFSCL